MTKDLAEVRLNADGSLDEVVGTGFFHLEQMDTNCWWMRLDTKDSSVIVYLQARGRVGATWHREAA